MHTPGLTAAHSGLQYQCFLFMLRDVLQGQPGRAVSFVAMDEDFSLSSALCRLSGFHTFFLLKKTLESLRKYSRISYSHGIVNVGKSEII